MFICNDRGDRTWLFGGRPNKSRQLPFGDHILSISSYFCFLSSSPEIERFQHPQKSLHMEKKTGQCDVLSTSQEWLVQTLYRHCSEKRFFKKKNLRASLVKLLVRACAFTYSRQTCSISLPPHFPPARVSVRAVWVHLCVCNQISLFSPSSLNIPRMMQKSAKVESVFFSFF